MKRLIIIALTVFALFAFAGTAAAEASAEKETVTYKGYLIDKACNDMGKGMDGSDIVNAPWDHTKMCLLAEPCKKSGYGISIKDGSAYTTYYKFDDDGDKLALEQIMNSDKEDDFEIEVKGVLDGDVLVVSSITFK